MATDNRNILDKIKKCLALSASANEHEAAAALRQAQKLMELHGVTDEDVLASQAGEAGAKAGAVTKPAEWEAKLAGRIGQAFGCQVVFSRRTWSTAEWRFIGAGASSEVAAYAFKVLLRQARTARQTYITTALKRVRKPSVKTVLDQFTGEVAVEIALERLHAGIMKATVASAVPDHYPQTRAFRP